MAISTCHCEESIDDEAILPYVIPAEAGIHHYSSLRAEGVAILLIFYVILERSEESPGMAAYVVDPSVVDTPSRMTIL